MNDDSREKISVTYENDTVILHGRTVWGKHVAAKIANYVAKKYADVRVTHNQRDSRLLNVADYTVVNECRMMLNNRPDARVA